MALSKNLTRAGMQAYGVKPTFIPCSFRPNGASGIVASSTRGPITVVRDNVGLYTVTFDEPLGTVLCILPGLRYHDADGLPPTWCDVGDYDSAAKTLKVNVVQEGAAGGAAVNVDLAADVNNVVNFLIITDESSALLPAR